MSWFKSKLQLVAARASDALAQAADIVAPTLYESRIEEFHHRWTTISRFLESILARDVDSVEQRRLLSESHTRDSLQKLVLLLYAEESAVDRLELIHSSIEKDSLPQKEEPVRACLEYVLERQIVPHLCDVGRRDQPSGIMILAIQFVGALLGRINYPLLPTREIHVSVIALIQAATKREVDDPVIRKCLLQLLNILWKKLRCDPVQTEFFFLHASQLRSSSSPEVSDLVLFTSLLPHMYANGKSGEKCREALVMAASIHEPALCRFIIKLTPFCHYAVNGVITAFDALPKTIVDRTKSQRGIESEISLLAVRLRFCCTLAMVGRFELEMDGTPGTSTSHSISHEILSQFQQRFLQGPFLEGLMHTSETTAQTATLYARIILEELAACGIDAAANPLLLVFVEFLVQQEEGGTPSLSSTLLHRMDSLSSELSILTMDLFTSLLELQDPTVDDILLGNMTPLKECEKTDRRRHSLVNSPHSKANEAVWLASRFPHSAVASNAHVWKIQAFNASDIDIPMSTPSEGKQDAFADHQVVSLLSYIADAECVTCHQAPKMLKEWGDESDDETEEDDDELREDNDGEINVQNGRVMELQQSQIPASPRTAAARNAVKPLKEISLTISMPSYSPVKTAFPHVTPPTAIKKPADPSLFVRLVLHRLERVLESSFNENLALSGLVSALAQKSRCATIVFDTMEKLGEGQTLRSVLEEVHADAIRRIGRLVNGDRRLVEIRRQLVEENQGSFGNEHEAETRLLCGFVIVEEMLKELCSILFARERVRCLPVKPEGYYLEPKRVSTPSKPSLKDVVEKDEVVDNPPMSIGQEFEQLIAEAETQMGNLLITTT